MSRYQSIIKRKRRPLVWHLSVDVPNYNWRGKLKRNKYPQKRRNTNHWYGNAPEIPKILMRWDIRLNPTLIYAKADNIVFTMSSFLPPQIRLYWYGMFSALLGVKVYKNSYEWLYFDVLPSIQLHSIFMEDDVVTQGSMLPIRILWKNGISGCWIHIQMI